MQKGNPLLRNESLRKLMWAITRSVSCALLLSLLLTACTPPPKPQIRIGTNIWAGYEPLYLADSLGLLDHTGISLIEYASSRETMRALRHGSIEAGALTLNEVLTLAGDGVDLHIVLLLDVSDGADAVIAHPWIGAPADLRGRNIGLESSSLGGYMLNRLLETAGLRLDEIHIVPLLPSELERAFIDKSVDAVVSFEPVKSRLLDAGGKVIFDSSQIPGEIVDVLAVRADVLAAHPDSLNSLAASWFQALDYMQQHPDAAARGMQPRLGLPTDQILTQFNGIRMGDRQANRDFFDNPASPPVKKASLMLQVMQAQRILNREVDVSRLFAGGHADFGTAP